MLSKEVFCQALSFLLEQQKTDEDFAHALEKVGSGYFLYGTGNRYREALLLVLKEGINDRFDYISWWLYDGPPGFEVWDETAGRKWILREPEALYDFIVNDCQN